MRVCIFLVLYDICTVFQVEFCYPPIDFKDPLADVKEGEIFIPKQWSALPYLAMPDGAHNYEDGWSRKYFIFFNVLINKQIVF